MDEELRRKRQYAGRMGALANLQRYGAQATGRRLYEGKLRKYAAEVDPHGILSETERKQRVQYRLNADTERAREAKRRREHLLERQYGRTEEEMNRAVEKIAHPPIVCVYCCQESGQPFPPDASGGICATHAAKVFRAAA